MSIPAWTNIVGYSVEASATNGWRLLLLANEAQEETQRRIEEVLGNRHHLIRVVAPELAQLSTQYDAALLIVDEPSRLGGDVQQRRMTVAPHLPLIALVPEGFEHFAPVLLEKGAQEVLTFGQLDGLYPAIRKSIERFRRVARLEFEVSHDELTGLPRRRLFLDEVAREMERSKIDRSHKFGVLVLNLDRFKLINDGLGPSYGDQLLVALAQRMQRCLQGGDMVSRLGGGEFAILLRNLNGDKHAPFVCQSLQRETAQPFHFGRNEVFTTASIGLTTHDPKIHRPEEMLRQAGIALHHAKSEGSGRYCSYEPSMHDSAELRFRREMELRQSIGQGDFMLYYQPIVDLSTGTLQGFEGLLRWQHPTEGLVPPDQFIPIAEETGLIVPIERWVMRRGCEQLRTWRETNPGDSPLHLHLNLSGKHLGRPELASELSSIIREQKLDPSWLSIEITESALVENKKAAIDLLGRLREIGCTLSIDDFGTGYSSLACLQSYPLDTLKVDRAFIRELRSDADSHHIVRAILELAHGFRLDVVAEGIETVEQLAILERMGCDRGQGYLISPPLPPEAATRWVQEARDGTHWETLVERHKAA